MFGHCGGWSAPAGVNAPDPDLCCPPDALCKFYTKDFWQCQPKGYNAPPEPATTYDSACGNKTKVRTRPVW